MIKIALIDDGVKRNSNLARENIKHYKIENGNVICNKILEEDCCGEHGTMCARILNQVNKEIEIYDLNIFRNGSADVEDVILMLKFCLNLNVAVINMSCGTQNYIDYKKMEPVIENLINNNIFIVSAFCNNNILSFPAVCKKVFGVRRDISKILKFGEYGFQMCDNLNIENSLVANYSSPLFSDNSFLSDGNSFAAPIITGQISNILKYMQDADFEKVLSKLRTNCVPLCRGDNITLHVENQDLHSQIPIVCINNFNIAKRLQKELQDLGYSSLIFYDYDRQGDIPIHLYCHKDEKVSCKLICTIERIYLPDLIILNLNDFRYQINNLWENIDLIIENKGKAIIITSSDSIKLCLKIRSVLDYILAFFS
ncbi:S8 family serine peptidase [Blautia schinkii]|nr:S8 family serine peptidase [Blautia schinkii]